LKAFVATLAFFLVASAALAGGIDGKWKYEHKVGKKGEGAIYGLLLDLKSSGSKLTGTVTILTPMTARDFPIDDGKLDGNRFSFSSSLETSHGVITTYYQGTLEGDTLKGTMQRTGAKRVEPFEATRE
jgi:hypothetical protein